MGSYRGKVTDDVIGHTPSAPNETEYKTNIYGNSLKKSDQNHLTKLNHRLSNLLDEDGFIGNFLYFDDENYIPIEFREEFLVNLDFEISFNSNDFIELWESIKLKNENYIFDFEYSNIYIGFGLIEYKDYLIPLCFIPINFTEKYHGITVYRNKNLDISINYCLYDELYNIEFPVYSGDIAEFINKINVISEIRFLKKAYVGNFNLNSINYCNDLTEDWSNSLDKFKLFFNKKYIYNSSDIVKLNNKLASEWIDLDLKLNNLDKYNADVLVKNLLSDGKSILVVADKFQREDIKNKLYLSGLDDLILDSSILSKNHFHDLISDEYHINIEDENEFNRLNEELSEIEECCEILNTKYSQLNLYPKDIKKFKDKYYDLVKDIPHDFPIKNAKTYKASYFNKLKGELVNVISNNELENINQYLPDNFFNSSNYNIFKSITQTFEKNLNTFIEINNQVNDIYGIKKFEDLSEVKYLENLDVLEKPDNLFVDEIDRGYLNNFLKIKYDSIVNLNELNDKSFEDILEKYKLDECSIETIINYIKYSELIDFNVFEDENLIKSNLPVIINDLEILLDVNSYLLKQVDYIEDFYDIFKCFKPSLDLFEKRDIATLTKLIARFKDDFNRLERHDESYDIKISDMNLKNYYNYWQSGEIKKDDINDVFSYNFYNSILNSFLDEYENIAEEYIVTSYYKNKYKEILFEIKKRASDQFKQSIYLKLNELNHSDTIVKQKEELTSKLSNNELYSIKSALSDYKDYIFANKRVSMINLESLPLIFDKTFEKFFDYAIVFNKEDVDELCYLSVFLRTKNNLIIVGKGG